MLMVTTETISGYEIEEYLGYISETVTLGINDFLEFFQISDTFGGESSSYKSKFDEAKGILNKRLEAKAKEIQGNAIIGLRINYTEIAGKGKSSILVSGTGTVVKVEMTEKQKNKLKEKEKEIEKIALLQEEEKKKEFEEYKNYIFKLTIKELIKELESKTLYNKKDIKDVILEREDIKKEIEKFSNYDTDILRVMQGYNENAKLVLILKRIK